MKHAIQLRTLVCALAGLLAAQANAITVVATTNANSLTSTVLGPGITLVGTPTLVGGPTSAGTFTNGLTTGIGINSGIVLTTGSVNLIGNSNTDDGITGNFSGAGDAALTTIAGQPTHDATSLTFNFTTTSGAASFRFVFGSEEYNEYANSQYNDVFAFFLNGSNIALLPGTTTPISINTVNGGNPLGVGAVNPTYYVNNDPGPYAFEYDGFTKVFSVGVTGLATAATHTIKLAIADTSDFNLDSGVFIEANSFTEQPPDNNVPDGGSTLLLTVLGLGALAGLRRLR